MYKGCLVSSWYPAEWYVFPMFRPRNLLVPRASSQFGWEFWASREPQGRFPISILHSSIPPFLIGKVFFSKMLNKQPLLSIFSLFRKIFEKVIFILPKLEKMLAKLKMMFLIRWILQTSKMTFFLISSESFTLFEKSLYLENKLFN